MANKIFKKGDKIVDADGFTGIVMNVPIGKFKDCLLVKYGKCTTHVAKHGCRKINDGFVSGDEQ